MQVSNKRYKFSLGSRQRFIYISSDFESGNIEVTRQITEFYVESDVCSIVWLVSTMQTNSRSWFYFRVHGFPRQTRGRFAVSKVQTLLSVFKHSPPDRYRPVCRSREGEDGEWTSWVRLPTPATLVHRQNGQLEVSFEYLFRNEEQQVQLAFTYPYTYTDNLTYLNSLNEFYSTEQLYFHKQVLIRSPLQNDAHLITITSYPQRPSECEQEALFNTLLFPQKCRPLKFNKPVVLISARVHPGETAASFAMEGVINFLTDLTDLRAHLLRKMFLFMIVPMLNVDGVKLGHFRMDSYGKNLNRYYIAPNIDQQPIIYAVKELAAHLHHRMAFYFDLHAHNACKGCFIYGNAINDFVEQVETQVFCKAFAMNDLSFSYEHCNFSMKQMKSKDKYEELTKEGCGRVVMHKLAKIVHSYSLQCGIMGITVTQNIPPTMNSDFTACGKKLAEGQIMQIVPQKKGQAKTIWFTPQHYKSLGRNLLVTILDIFDKNPYSRVYNSSFGSLEMLRRLTAFEVFHNTQRFRMFERYVYGKVKNINQLIRDVLNEKLHYRELNNCYFCDDKELRVVKWPNNILGLTAPKMTQKKFAPSLVFDEETHRFITDLRSNKKKFQEEALKKEEGKKKNKKIIDSSDEEGPIQQEKLTTAVIQVDYNNQIPPTIDGQFKHVTQNQMEIDTHSTVMQQFQEPQSSLITTKESKLLKSKGQLSIKKFILSKKIIKFQTYSPSKNSQQTYSPSQKIFYHKQPNSTHIINQQQKDAREEWLNAQEEIKQKQGGIIKNITEISTESTLHRTKKDSSSVRVRKMLNKQEKVYKQDKNKRIIMNDEDIKIKLDLMMQNIETSSSNMLFKSLIPSSATLHPLTTEILQNDIQSRLFESIRNELKSQLMRHNNTSRKDEVRMKGAKINVKRNTSVNQRGVSCKFPSIGDHLLIIASSKGLQKQF